MFTPPRPVFFYPPSVEFLLRRSLAERTRGARPSVVPSICAACGALVDDHREKGTNTYIDCAEVQRRRAARAGA